MSTVAKIKCYSCDNVFDYYLHLRKPEEEIKRPHCLKTFEEQSKQKLFFLMGEFDDLNKDYRKHCKDRKENLFQFDLITVENPIDFGFLDLPKR